MDVSGVPWAITTAVGHKQQKINYQLIMDSGNAAFFKNKARDRQGDGGERGDP